MIFEILLGRVRISFLPLATYTKGVPPRILVFFLCDFFCLRITQGCVGLYLCARQHILVLFGSVSFTVQNNTGLCGFVYLGRKSIIVCPSSHPKWGSKSGPRTSPVLFCAIFFCVRIARAIVGVYTRPHILVLFSHDFVSRTRSVESK